MRRTHRSQSIGSQPDYLRRRLVALAVGAAFGASVHANPSGQSVASGNASFALNGRLLTITNTPGAIINWQQFAIGKDEITRFIQQNAASAVLNRVVGQDPSAILGQLLSNGRVFLINPAGIAIGKGAVIDVAGFAASTLNISDADFISGRMRFAGAGSEGKLTNAGTINALDGGQVYLIAPNVENQASGVINAPGGEVMIVAGKTVELVNARTPDIRVEFTAPQNEAVNAGQVVAAGGRVGIYGTLIRNSGLVSATRATVGDGGKIILAALKDVTLDVGSRVEANGANGGSVAVRAETGTLLASGVVEAKGNEDKGGEVRLLGARVGLVGDARVDASGEKGGGTVLVGGDYQGSNPDVQNSQRTYVGKDAVINVDAVKDVDGGKAIVWSDEATVFYGSLSAKGGAQGGNGGFAEVSGKQLLGFRGHVDLTAPKGRTGTLLLDPLDIVINGGSADGSDSPDSSSTILNQDSLGQVLVGAGTGTFNVFESEIEGTAANIILRAGRNISTTGTFSNVTANPGDAAGVLALQSGFNLTLETRNNATDGAGSINTGAIGVATSGAGSINITGSTSGINAGNVTVGKLTAGGTGAITVAAQGGGSLTVADNVSSVGGAVVLKADSDVSITTGNVNVGDNNNGLTNLTIVADNDNSGAGNVILGGVTLQVGTSGANTGGMDISGQRISMIVSGGGNGTVQVTGSGAQSFTAKGSEIRFENQTGGSVNVWVGSGRQSFTTTSLIPGNGNMFALSSPSGAGTGSTSIFTGTGGSQNVTLTGGLRVESQTGGNASAFANLSADAGQTINAKYVEVLANGAGSANLANNTGTQSITTSGANASNEGLVIKNNGAPSGYAAVNSSGVSAVQDVTVNNADYVRVIGQGGGAYLLGGTSQTILVKGSGLNAIEVGSATATDQSHIHSANQSVNAGSITIQGGVTDAKNAIMFSDSGTQTIDVSGAISVTGGTATGPTGAQAQMSTFGTGQQHVSANSILVQGGNSGTGNQANISVFNSANTGGQLIDVGSGGIALTGGSGVGGNNSASIIQNGTGGTQVINVTGGNVALLGGTGSASNGASISNAGTAQTINVNNAALVSVVAQIGSAGITSSGDQTLTIQGASSANALTVGAATSANSSSISGNDQIVTAGTALQSGSIAVQGGSAAGKSSRIDSNSGHQSISTTGTLLLTGGTATGTARTCDDAGGSGSCAGINNFNTGTQTVSAEMLQIQGGNAGRANGALIFYRAGGSQQITVGAGGLSLQGGGGGTDNFAFIGATGAAAGNQQITVNGGNVALLGGVGDATNTANITNGPSGTSQTVTVNNAASVSVVAQAGSASIASSGDQALTIQGAASANALTIGSAASADSSSITGNNQVVTAGTVGQSGSITVLGGTGAGKNAFINSNSGIQTISTTGTLSLTGGTATGTATAPGTCNGALGSGSCADINNSGTGLQTVNAGTISIQGGSGGVSSGAGIFVQAGPQQINVGAGGLHLQGGTGTSDNFASIGGGGAAGQTLTLNVTGDTTLDSSNATLYSGTSIGLGGAGNAQTVTVVFNGTGDLTLTGSDVSASGAGIGAGSFTTNATANVTIGAKNITLNPGTQSTRGVYFGHSNVVNSNGAGNTVVTATGDIKLNEKGSVGSSIRTTGDVTLHADTAGKSITEAANSVIAASKLTTTSAAATNLAGTGNAVSTFAASTTNAASGDVALVNTGSLALGASTSVAGNYSITNTGSITTSGALALNGATNTITATGTTSDITISNAITRNATLPGALTFAAPRNVTFATGGSVTALGADGTLAVTLNTDTDQATTPGGAISMASGTSITSNGGNIILGGGATPATTAAIGATDGVAGIALNGATLAAGAGSVSLVGHGFDGGTTNNVGIRLASAAQITANGGITLTGTGGAGTDANDGVLITGAGSAVSAATGSIGIVAVAQGSGTDNQGFRISSGGAVTSTGAATISITGTGATAGVGINATTGASTIGGGAASGNITLKADSIAKDNAAVTTTGNVYLLPKTPATAVAIGGAGTGFDLSQGELTNITANRIFVGEDSLGAVTAAAVAIGASNPVSIGARNLTVTNNGATNNIAFGANGFASTADLTLNTQGEIVGNATGTNVTATSLNANAQKGIGSTTQLKTAVGTLSAINSGGAVAGNIDITNSLPLNLGGSSTVTNGGTGNISVAVTGATNDLTVSNNVSGGGAIALSGGRNVTVNTAAAVTATGVLTINFGQAGGGATLDLANSGTLSGSTVNLNGGTGSDTLAGRNVASSWNITGSNSGTLNGANFTSIENLKGGTNTDAFVFGAGATISGNINGGGGGGKLDYTAYTTAVAVTLSDAAGSGTGTGVLGTFSNITDVQGSTNNGTANNTLTGPNLPNTWNITNNNSGSVANVIFVGVQNLTGGTNTDVFVFGDGKSVSGVIDGKAGSDKLDWSAYTTARGVVLTGTGAIDGFNGTEASITGGFKNIDSVAGATGKTNTLQAPDAVNAWAITGANSGTLTSSGRTLNYSGTPSLTGGNTDDTFTVSPAASIGSVNGGAAGGTNKLIVNGTTSADTFTITGTAVTGAATVSSYSNIDSVAVNGSGGPDIFNVQDTSVPTTITGGSGVDTFNVSSNAPTNTGNLAAIAATLTLEGAGGANVLVISDAGGSTGKTVTVGAGSITGLAGPAGGTTINYAATGGTFGTFTLLGSTSAGDSFTVSGFPANVGNFTINAGGGADTISVNTGVSTSGSQSYTASTSISLAADLTSTGSGTISLTGPVILAAPTVTIATAGGAGDDISFSTTINSDGTARNLVLNAGTSGNTTLGGSIGAGNPLGSLQTDAGGTTAINGGAITATGTQVFNDNVTLGANTSLSGTTMTFNGTVVGNAHSLAVTSGNAVFGDQPADTVTGLSTLSVAGTTKINTDTITSSGDQTYTGMVTLGTGTTLTGATPTFTTGVTGAGKDLTLSFTGTTLIDGAKIQGVKNLTSNNNGTTQLTGTITTTGTQTYSDAVVLTGDTTAAAGANLVKFSNTVDAQSSGGQSLTVNGAGGAQFDNVVGATKLSNLAVTGPTAINTSAISTTGTQIYDETVTLGTTSNLTGSTVTFNDPVVGANKGLTVTGNAVFGNAVGDTVTGLSSLHVTGTSLINTNAVTSTGTQTYDQTVTLGTTSNLSGSTVTFNDPVAGGGNALTVTGNAVFGNAAGDTVTGLSSLHVTGTSLINTDTVSSSGTQTYDQTVTLGTTSNLTGSTVTFNDPVAGGGNALTVTGNAVFGDAVADTVTGLSSLHVTGTSLINTNAMSSTGTQQYDQTVTLGTNTTLTTTAGGNILAAAITGSGSGGQNLTLAAGAGSITVSGNVGATRLGVLTVSSGNAVAFQDTGTQQVASLAVTSSTSTTFSGHLNLTNGVALAGVAGDVSFLNGLTTGAASSFLNTGTLQLGDATGDSTSLTVGLTHNAGPTVLAGSITPNGAVSLGVTTIPTGQTAEMNVGGNDVTFNASVNGPGELIVNSDGITTFAGNVGTLSALSRLTTRNAAGANVGGGTTVITGSIVTTNGPQNFYDAVTTGAGAGQRTFNSGGGDVLFDRSLTGNGGNVTLNLGAGGALAGNLNIAGALTNVNNLDVTASNSTVINSNNAVAGTVAYHFTGPATGNVDHLEAGTVNLAASQVGGMLSVTSNTGDIVQDGAVTVGNGAIYTANNGNIKIGGVIGGNLVSTGLGAAIRMHAGDDITVSSNGGVITNQGDIEVIAGYSAGLDTAHIQGRIPRFQPETVPDNAGAVTLNGELNAANGAAQGSTAGGNVTIVTAGLPDASASASDITQTAGGRIVGNRLTAVTLKGALPGGLSNGGALVDLNDANIGGNPSNSNAEFQLFSCPANGCPAPSPLRGVAIVELPPLNQYANGLLFYSDSSGATVAGTGGTGSTTLVALGTATDFKSFVNGPFNLAAFPFSARTVTIEATGPTGSISIDLRDKPLTQINDQGVGSLTFNAGKDINVLSTSQPIGTSGNPFSSDLKMQAGGNITIDNNIYVGSDHTLTLAANSNATTDFQVLQKTGSGSVTLQGNYVVKTGGNAQISGVNFSLLGGDTGGPNQSPNGQELTASGTINLLNTGVINVQAGESTITSASGARLTGGTVNIGVNGSPNNPTRLTIQGGSNNIGIASSVASGSPEELRQADAVVEAKKSMFVYLGKDPALPAPVDAFGNPYAVGAPYSLLIRGGSAQTNGNSSMLVTAIGALRANDLVMVADGSLVLQGGAAKVDAAGSFAAADALILVKNDKKIDTRSTGSFIIRGGKAEVIGDPVRARNTTARAALDPSTLTMNLAGNLILQGGVGPSGSVTSARIDAGGDININVHGPGISYSYTTSSGGTNVLSGQAFMIGGSGSGIFDKSFLPLDGRVSPILINVSMTRVIDPGLGDAVIQTGRNVFDQSLLNYTIFAANEAANTRRIRRLGSDDDGGAAACQ
jgi:hypothetical protein